MKTKPSLADRKAAVSRTTERYKKAIESEVDGLKENAGRIGKNALIITGALLASYLVVRLLVGKGKEKPKSKHTISADENRYLPVAPARRESTIVSLIKQQIALFLIAIAKEQIAKAIEQLRRNEK
ncbi:MAG: hypothetical protein MUD08_00325 [Cytophagales bacterium]|jgi:hypothetical protein|nr:hypothetical protein [Cytophagales bacterium]